MAKIVSWTLLCAVGIAVGITVASVGQHVAQSKPPYAVTSPGDPSHKGEGSAGRAGNGRSQDGAASSRGSTQPRLVTRGVTVQVLNGTHRMRSARHMARRLRSLGLTVVVVNPAVKIYRRTTVFWSHASGQPAAALRLCSD